MEKNPHNGTSFQIANSHIVGLGTVNPDFARQISEIFGNLRIFLPGNLALIFKK